MLCLEFVKHKEGGHDCNMRQSANLPYDGVVVQASGIPAFYVAFCVTPFASNASELVSSIIFASRKQKKNISLTFSQACPSALNTQI